MLRSPTSTFQLSILYLSVIFFLRCNLCISSNSVEIGPELLQQDAYKGSLRKNRPSNSIFDRTHEGEKSLNWPFHHKNCNTINNCTACYQSSLACHWCSNDDKCHARGGWHGCSVGATCPSDDPVDNSCHAHKTCEDCSLASRFCHWCAYDDQCHAIGSVHGCVSGVNCYSNDRCKRSKPEPIHEGSFDHIGFIPLVLIFSVAFMSLCCVSVLFAGAGALSSLNLYGNRHGNAPPMEAFSLQDFSQDQALLQLTPMHEESIDQESDGNNDEIEVDDEASSSEAVNDKRKRNGSNRLDSENGNENEGEVQIEERESALALVEENQNSHGILPSGHDDLIHDSQSQLTESLLPRPVTAHPHPSRLPRFRNLHLPESGNCYIPCLMRSCKLWLFFSILAIVGFTTASIVYFPKEPEYNICSDEFAWSSIIKGLTSVKMEASFEILISVKNKNRLDLALEGLGGKFQHDGVDIGTFSLPRTIIGATSISDLLVTCTVVPGRWKALGLIADYWKGDLSVLVDANGSVKVKGLGLSLPIKVSDALVKVTDPDMDDRHLCACPEWKDLVPTASPRLSFEEAVTSPVAFNLDSSLSDDDFETT